MQQKKNGNHSVQRTDKIGTTRTEPRAVRLQRTPSASNSYRLSPSPSPAVPTSNLGGGVGASGFGIFWAYLFPLVTAVRNHPV